MPFVVPLFEDRPAFRLGVSEIARRIAANQIDNQRARLLLYACQIAACALPRELPARKDSDDPEEESEYESQRPVVDLTLDPDHGPLAPIAKIPELGTKERTVGSGILQQLAEEVRGHRPFCPLCNPTGTQEESDPPATIPRLDASAEDTAPAPGGPSFPVSSERMGVPASFAGGVATVGYRAQPDRHLPTHPGRRCAPFIASR
jgi:hypothetical protein